MKKKSFRSVILPFLTIFIIVMCQEGWCTFMKKLTLDDLTEKAKVIVIGKVESIESRWNEEHTMIFTYVDIIPNSFLKGFIGGGKITVKLLGGSVGDIETVVLGSPRFENGEETVLFLNSGYGEWFQNFYAVVGLAQGKFDVSYDPNTSAKIVSQNLSQINFVGSVQHPFREKTILFDDFLMLIKTKIKL